MRQPRRWEKKRTMKKSLKSLSTETLMSSSSSRMRKIFAAFIRRISLRMRAKRIILTLQDLLLRAARGLEPSLDPDEVRPLIGIDEGKSIQNQKEKYVRAIEYRSVTSPVSVWTAVLKLTPMSMRKMMSKSQCSNPATASGGSRWRSRSRRERRRHCRG